ncbi:MAG: hypothetical protein P8076_04570 [Gammaproteobacteria bacterium]
MRRTQFERYGTEARRAAVAATLAAAATLSGCASLTKGSAQTIAITTDPAGAACTLTRAGKVIGEINPTPSTVSVFKSGKPIVVRCRKEGYNEGSARLGSSFETMTLGNVIFGGLVGVVIDAGSGATHDYPTTLDLALIPEHFASAAARDAFFARLRKRVVAHSEQAIERIRAECQEGDCSDQIKKVQAARDTRLEQVEKERAGAELAP